MQLVGKIGPALLCLLACGRSACAQTSDLTMKIDLMRDHSHQKHVSGDKGSGNVVVWLMPVQSEVARTVLKSLARPQGGYVLTQKDRQFTPHLLVVPVGSSVEFPNFDPFFHNVFSLYNGKRFDLGLYEAHSQRSVRFDREGISYIFCNIHPEMGAVVIALGTPYYAISAADGSVAFNRVPAGRYRLKLWSESVSSARLAAAERSIEVGAGETQLDTIHLQTSGDLVTEHSNKFGEAYKPSAKDLY